MDIKKDLKARLQFLQKSIAERSTEKDNLYKEGMKLDSYNKAVCFRAASKCATEIATMRKEVNGIFKQLKKK